MSVCVIHGDVFAVNGRSVYVVSHLVPSDSSGVGRVYIVISQPTRIWLAGNMAKATSYRAAAHGDVSNHSNICLYRLLQLGPNGYAFAINSNGYIVFHPYLKAKVGSRVTT